MWWECSGSDCCEACMLQFCVLPRSAFMLPVFQVYFRKGKVLQDSGFVGDALQLFLQCLALDEDFLPARKEVERVILLMKLNYCFWLDSFMVDFGCLKIFNTCGEGLGGKWGPHKMDCTVLKSSCVHVLTTCLWWFGSCLPSLWIHPD